MIPDFTNVPSFVNMIKNFSKWHAEEDYPNRVDDHGPLVVRHRTPRDAFLNTYLYIPNSSLTQEVYAYNEGYDSIIGEINKDGSISTPHFNNSVKISESNIHSLNTRRNPVKRNEKFFQFCVAPGYRFSQKNLFQTLQVIQKRYAGPAKTFPFNQEADLLADRIATQFVEDTMDLNDSRRRIDEYVLNELWRGWISAAESKKYFNMFRGHDDYDWATVCFHLKTIFKPKMFLKLEQLSKVGQGISAWGKDAQILFAMVGRVLNHSLITMLKSHIIYDNKITQDELFEKVRELNLKVPSVALNGVTDMTEFDKNQNLFSQRIEFHIWRRMGFSVDMLDHYYSLRKNYRIRSEAGSARVKAAKTSGEPLTLANNTILAAAITNWLLRGDGPFYMVMKGDDMWKRQCAIKIRRDRLYEIQKYVDFDLKLSIDDSVEYCGNIVTTSGMFPNLLRKLYKIASHSFRDYEHFCEYQISLRDYVNSIQHLERKELFAVNMQMINCNYDQVEGIFDAIVSFSHISNEQFFQHFRKVEIGYGIPRRSNNKYVIEE